MRTELGHQDTRTVSGQYQDRRTESGHGDRVRTSGQCQDRRTVSGHGDGVRTGGQTSSQRGGCDAVGPLTSSQSRVGLQVKVVSGGLLQVVEVVCEGAFTDGLLQLCTVRL